jgi:hypothetical protein
VLFASALPVAAAPYAGGVIGCTAPWPLFPCSGRFGPDVEMARRALVGSRSQSPLGRAFCKSDNGRFTPAGFSLDDGVVLFRRRCTARDVLKDQAPRFRSMLWIVGIFLVCSRVPYRRYSAVCDRLLRMPDAFPPLDVRGNDGPSSRPPPAGAVFLSERGI